MKGKRRDGMSSLSGKIVVPSLHQSQHPSCQPQRWQCGNPFHQSKIVPQRGQILSSIDGRRTTDDLASGLGCCFARCPFITDIFADRFISYPTIGHTFMPVAATLLVLAKSFAFVGRTNATLRHTSLHLNPKLRS